MRKLAYILLATCLLLSISSCKTVSNSNPNPNPDSVVTDAEGIPKETNDIYSLIPSGWKVLNKEEKQTLVEGDLNKDGFNDVGAVIEEIKSQTDEAPQRALLIAFGNEDNNYRLSIIADHVILKADEGGVWGDPFDSISIDRGSLVVSHYGGSNWRWFNTYRFRYQDNDWYLIGATTGEYFTGSATEEEANEQDYNFLTGDYIIKKTDESGKQKTTHGNKGKKELIKLKDFNPENINLYEQ
ncbi:hypothetical protein [Paenibacillus solani]|uniref:hypothetical protein n=1 Tax=Paenibacillus solani TaxID=1705565 RepID=UPI003D280BB2